MPTKSDIARTTALESEAASLINAELKLSESHRAEKHTAPRQVMRIRHLPREQRLLSYADKDMPRILPEARTAEHGYSRAYLKQPVSLYSNRAQRFLEANYERNDQTLIVATLVVEDIGKPDLIDETYEKLNKLFSDMERELINSLKELKKGMDAKGIPESQQVPAYDHKRRYEPPLHTPFSSQYLSLIMLYDRLVARCEGAWVNGLISSQDRRNVLDQWEQALRDFGRQLYQIRAEAMKKARMSGHRQSAAQIERKAQVQSADLNGRDETTDAAEAAVREQQAEPVQEKETQLKKKARPPRRTAREADASPDAQITDASAPSLQPPEDAQKATAAEAGSADNAEDQAAI